MSYRNDWTHPEIQELYQQPLMDLLFQAQTIHREHFQANHIQVSTLLSIKTGKCPEDCKYCSQSAHYDSGLEAEKRLAVEKKSSMKRKLRLPQVLRVFVWALHGAIHMNGTCPMCREMVREVKALGLETCMTLGMLNQSQAERLHEAGLDYYNHNLDTSA